MSKVKHTPGPWWTNGYNIMAGPNDRNLASRAPGWPTDSPQEREEGKANARLMAAAPEMLEALKRVCSEVDIVAYTSVLKTVYEAVEKAEGK